MNITKATPADIPQIMQLLQKRIDWMDDMGLYQWNKTHYLDCYPASYFEEKIRGELVLVAREGADLTAVMALFSHDPRWQDDGVTAYYVHHLATDPQHPGLGRTMLDYAEQYARAGGRQALRLDSQLVNGKLSRYYEALGYRPVGQCVDGEYVGILREKFL